VRIDLTRRTANMLISDAELAERRAAFTLPELVSQTPWQELQRLHVGQLSSGACLDFAIKYQRISTTKGIPRDNH
jgi:dihydroxy-acid dehydratase